MSLPRLSTITVTLISISVGVADDLAPELSVQEIMNGILTPATNTIWGAYQLESESQWKEVENAAIAVIGAANLLMIGGSGEGEAQMALQAEWQSFNQQMLNAAEQILVVVEKRDEDALSLVSNDALYPPCESCHQAYQK